MAWTAEEAFYKGQCNPSRVRNTTASKDYVVISYDDCLPLVIIFNKELDNYFLSSTENWTTIFDKPECKPVDLLAALNETVTESKPDLYQNCLPPCYEEQFFMNRARGELDGSKLGNSSQVSICSADWSNQSNHFNLVLFILNAAWQRSAFHGHEVLLSILWLQQKDHLPRNTVWFSVWVIWVITEYLVSTI